MLSDTVSRLLGITERRRPPPFTLQPLSQVVPHVADSDHSPAATTQMKTPRALVLAFRNLTDENYEQTLQYFRFWLRIGQTYCQFSPGLLFDIIDEAGTAGAWDRNSRRLLIHPNVLRTLRFISDVESDPILAPHSVGLRDRFCASVLQAFFDANLATAQFSNVDEDLYSKANFVAHCVNLGYVEEDTIRDHILQSMVTHQMMRERHLVALAILFKIAGITFETYADPAIVSRCFECLETFRSPNKAEVELVQASTVFVWGR